MDFNNFLKPTGNKKNPFEVWEQSRLRGRSGYDVRNVAFQLNMKTFPSSYQVLLKRCGLGRCEGIFRGRDIIDI